MRLRIVFLGCVLRFALSCSGDDAAPSDGGAEQHADAGGDADAAGSGGAGGTDGAIGMAGTSSTSSDSGAVERDVCLGDEEPNVTCPDAVGPCDGPCAPQGAC